MKNKNQNEIEKERYERYIEETIDDIKDYIRETKGEDINKYHYWKDMLEIVETFRVDMLSIMEDKGSQSNQKDVLKILKKGRMIEVTGGIHNYNDENPRPEEVFALLEKDYKELKKRLEQNDSQK